MNLADLIAFLNDIEWRGRQKSDLLARCPSCDATKAQRHVTGKDGLGTIVEGGHLPDCELVRLRDTLKETPC